MANLLTRNFIMSITTTSVLDIATLLVDAFSFLITLDSNNYCERFFNLKEEHATHDTLNKFAKNIIIENVAYFENYILRGIDIYMDDMTSNDRFLSSFSNVCVEILELEYKDFLTYQLKNDVDCYPVAMEA
jgi:hypothetical protein